MCCTILNIVFVKSSVFVNLCTIIKLKYGCKCGEFLYEVNIHVVLGHHFNTYKYLPNSSVVKYKRNFNISPTAIYHYS